MKVDKSFLQKDKEKLLDRTGVLSQFFLQFIRKKDCDPSGDHPFSAQLRR
jgi:hypothetical protein